MDFVRRKWTGLLQFQARTDMTIKCIRENGNIDELSSSMVPFKLVAFGVPTAKCLGVMAHPYGKRAWLIPRNGRLEISYDD